MSKRVRVCFSICAWMRVSKLEIEDHPHIFLNE